MNHLGDANKMVGEDHIRDATKMVSDTPRTDEAYFKNSATMYDLAGEMKRVERELNAANEKIEVLLIADCERLRIEEELNAANQRIKRLEEAGDAMELYCDAISADNWRKAKEAKP